MANYSNLPILANNNVINNKTNHEEDEIYHAYTLQLIGGCTLTVVLKATIDLGVLQVIHDHTGTNGLSPVELAFKLQIQNPDAPSMLDRMLQLLATYLVVKCTTVCTDDGGVERRYHPSPVTKFLVPDDDKVSLVPLLNFEVDMVFLNTWSKLREAVSKGGIPFQMFHGLPLFEYLSVDSRFNEVFNQAMLHFTILVIKNILENYKGLVNVKDLVDVGGGLGHSLHVIKSQYPSIRAINFDLPHVIQNALPYPGVEHVSGDMFECIPKADAIFLKSILHNWTDEHCLKLLKNCYTALPENGKVIVMEVLLTGEPGTSFSARARCVTDVHMMALTVGGKERSKEEFESLAKAAGFTKFKLDCCFCDYSVMEFYK